MTSRPMTFFLVDDDFDDASLFQATLSDVDPNITFAHAADGQEALDQLLSKSIRPNLIFLDLNMPRMDGKECLTLIKQEDDLKDIPVIMYTTSQMQSDIDETKSLGAVYYLTKPDKFVELKKAIEFILDLKGNKKI